MSVAQPRARTVKLCAHVGYAPCGASRKIIMEQSWYSYPRASSASSPGTEKRRPCTDAPALHGCVQHMRMGMPFLDLPLHGFAANNTPFVCAHHQRMSLGKEPLMYAVVPILLHGSRAHMRIGNQACMQRCIESNGLCLHGLTLLLSVVTKPSLAVSLAHRSMSDCAPLSRTALIAPQFHTSSAGSPQHSLIQNRHLELKQAGRLV